MSMIMTGQVIRDREADTSFIVHDDCADQVEGMYASMGIAHRIVRMGPAFGEITADDCAFVRCAAKMAVTS